MEFEVLIENIAVFLVAIGGLWFGSTSTLTKVVKPLLHQVRDRYLKDNATAYQVVLQVILALIAFGMTFASPETFDFFAIFNPNIESVAGIVDYHHSMGALLVAVPLTVFFGETIHDRMPKKIAKGAAIPPPGEVGNAPA